MCLYLGVPVTILAAAFWTLCSLSLLSLGIPYSRLMSESSFHDTNACTSFSVDEESRSGRILPLFV